MTIIMYVSLTHLTIIFSKCSEF